MGVGAKYYSVFLLAIGVALCFSTVELSAQCTTPITMTATASNACVGGTVSLVSTVTNPSSNVFSGSANPIPDLNIPDGSLTGVSSSINIVGSGTVNAGTFISVNFNITSTWDDDLDIYLVGPGNCGAMELSTDNGTNLDNYINTTISTSAANSIILGTPPFTDTYLPEGTVTTPPNLTGGAGGGTYAGTIPATSLSGCPINGSWSLWVFDDVLTDPGTLNDWSLSVGTGYTHTHTGPGTISSITYTGAGNITGTSTVSGLPVGTSSFNLSISQGACTTTQAVTGKVFDTPVITSVTTTCATGNNASITVNVNPINNGNFTGGDIGSWQYSFNGGSTWGASNVATGLGAGNYTVMVRNSANTSCLATYVANIENIPTSTPGTVSNVCEGSSFNLTTVASGGNPAATYNGSASPNASIPDNSTTGASSAINIAGVGTVSGSTTISVTLNITHTWDGDLDIFLVGPGNCGAMLLSTDNGGAGDNYTNTVLSTTAATLISSGASPFTGTFLQEGSISTVPDLTGAANLGTYTGIIPATSLVGCPVNGDWTLRVFDDELTDVGTLNNWFFSIGGTSNYTSTFSGGSGSIGTVTYSGTANANASATVTGASVGNQTYQVYSTLSGCNSNAQNINVKVFDIPNISNVTGTCSSSNDGTVTITASINNANFTGGDIGVIEYSVNGTTWQTSNVFTGLAANTYTVWVRNSANPTCSASSVITIDGSPTTTPGAVSPVCEGSSFNLTTVASGGNPTITYSGSATSNTTIPDGSLTGTSSGIPITGTGNVTSSTGISVTLNITHTQDQDVDIFLVGPGNCGTYLLSTDNGGVGANYTGTIITTTGTTNVALGTAPFSATYKPEGLITAGVSLTGGVGGGTYSLPSTNLIGCPITGTWTLYVFDDFSGGGTGTFVNWSLGVSVSTNYTSAFSGGSGSIGSITYSGTANANATATVTGASVGFQTYQATSTLKTCTSTIQNINVKVFDIPNITGATTLCSSSNNGSITVTANINNANFTGSDIGVIEYSINGTTWQTSNMFTGLAAGSYTVWVRNSANTACISSGFAVTIITGITGVVTPASATTDCITQSADFTASGGTSYQWSNGLGTNAMVTVTPSSTSTYTVTVTAANGCSDSKTVTVTVDLSNAPASPVAIGDSICVSGNAELTASACASGSPQWYDAMTGGTLLFTGSPYTPSVSSTTTYYVQCTQGVCASVRTPVTVQVFPALPLPGLIVNPSTVVCEGQIVSYTATASPAGPYLYEYFVNGVSQGIPSLSGVFSYSPADGDLITVKIYYNF